MPKPPAAPEIVAPLGEVRLVTPSDLTPYPANARKITAKAVEQTAKSLKRFGWQQPIVCDPEMVIIAGHVRHRAATEILHLTQVPVVIADKLTDDEIRAYRIADNRTHDYVTWDYGLLATELDGLGGKFDAELDLADWQTIIGTFTGEGDGGGLDPLGGGQDLTGDGLGHLGAGYPLTVVFGSQDEADKAGPALLEIPGVVNVRHPRS